MDVSNITNVEMEDVHTFDYPDFCDAFVASATWGDSGEPLTEEDLEELNENHTDFVHEAAHESLR